KTLDYITCDLHLSHNYATNFANNIDLNPSNSSIPSRSRGCGCGHSHGHGGFEKNMKKADGQLFTLLYICYYRIIIGYVILPVIKFAKH
ncbi:3551_t:CDS:1, partial [Funneliformis geosporum]